MPDAVATFGSGLTLTLADAVELPSSVVRVGTNYLTQPWLGAAAGRLVLPAGNRGICAVSARALDASSGPEDAPVEIALDDDAESASGASARSGGGGARAPTNGVVAIAGCPIRPGVAALAFSGGSTVEVWRLSPASETSTPEARLHRQQGGGGGPCAVRLGSAPIGGVCRSLEWHPALPVLAAVSPSRLVLVHCTLAAPTAAGEGGGTVEGSTLLFERESTSQSLRCCSWGVDRTSVMRAFSFILLLYILHSIQLTP